MPSARFSDSYPQAVALLSSYRASLPVRQRQTWTEASRPPSCLAVSRPLPTIRRAINRIPAEPQVKHALWRYYVGGKNARHIAEAMSYTERQIYRLLSRGLSLVESLCYQPQQLEGPPADEPLPLELFIDEQQEDDQLLDAILSTSPDGDIVIDLPPWD